MDRPAQCKTAVPHEKRHLHVPSKATSLPAPGAAGPRRDLAEDDGNLVYGLAPVPVGLLKRVGGGPCVQRRRDTPHCGTDLGHL